MSQRATILYAKPPPDYFWAWSDDSSAAEWFESTGESPGQWAPSKGATIALWDELHPILHFLQNEGGLPPCGSILLLLAACREDWPEKELLLRHWMGTMGDRESRGPREDMLVSLLGALYLIHRLPKDLRQSQQAKCLLASAVFEDPESRLAIEVGQAVMAELVSGPGCVANENALQDSKSRFLHESKCLLTGFAQLKQDALEKLLRTGLEQELQPLRPEITPAATEGRSLLEDLAERGGEEGLAAAVAKRVIAMVNFPGRLGVPNELPVGGISDITNRGTVDRLLPGELAWDDLVLAARLVHNEALYFRREDPPQDTPLRHTVLLDRGLRLWGRRRVLSLGIALGLQHHPALLREGGAIEVFATLPSAIEALDLQSKSGVDQALQALMPSPGPEDALEKWRDATAAATGAEDLIFITAREHLESPRCKALLGEIATLLEAKAGACRVIVLDREDTLEIQSWSTGGNRVIFRGTLEDQELQLPPAIPSNSPQKLPWPHLKPTSLMLFPVVPKTNAFIHDPETGGGLGICGDGRLMRWPKAGWGALEIAKKAGGREQWLARDLAGSLILIASADAPGGTASVFRLSGSTLLKVTIARTAHAFPSFATVRRNAVIFCYSDLIEAISLETGSKVAELRGKNLPANPVLDFDGERIAVLGPDTAPQPELLEWRSDPLQRLQPPPKAISLVNGIIRLKAEQSVYTLEPTTLAWTEEKGIAAGPLVPFTDGGEGDATQRIARVGRMEAIYDPRGILRVKLIGARERFWEILLTRGFSSVWHSKMGLLSFEPRLRMPGHRDPSNHLLGKWQRFLELASK